MVVRPSYSRVLAQAAVLLVLALLAAAAERRTSTPQLVLPLPLGQPLLLGTVPESHYCVLSHPEL